MDPSRTICEVEKRSNYIKILYRDKSYSSLPISPRTRRNKILSKNNEEYEPYLQKIKEEKKEIKEEYIENPIINSDYFDKYDIILANIDAVYNVSGQIYGYLAPQNTKKFDFASLDGKGLVYIQYRLPDSRIFTNCPFKFLDDRKLNINCDDLSSYVLGIEPLGVDLVTSFNVITRKELITILKICKNSSIYKVDENNIDLKLVYITSLCFETISLFKPISEDINSPYSYLIAQNYKGNSRDWVTILEDNDIDKIFLPDEFFAYIENYMNSLTAMKKDLFFRPITYNVYKCKAIWNIF